MANGIAAGNRTTIAGIGRTINRMIQNTCVNAKPRA